MEKYTERFSEYKLMWILVMFDLPVETKIQRKEANDYRKYLIKDGFTMFQYSIYVRNCSSKENAQVHEDRISRAVPSDGKVCVITITDKQFKNIRLFEGAKKAKPIPEAIQLELF